LYTTRPQLLLLLLLLSVFNRPLAADQGYDISKQHMASGLQFGKAHSASSVG
jgi:hypothetical protein